MMEIDGTRAGVQVLLLFYGITLLFVLDEPRSNEDYKRNEQAGNAKDQHAVKRGLHVNCHDDAPCNCSDGNTRRLRERCDRKSTATAMQW